MRPVNKDAQPTNAAGTVVTFPVYNRSRRYLINTIGEYCSYCERPILTSLAVEHIQPKTHNPHLELVWSNLLLACTNCNSTKGHTNVVLADYFWPDRDNTFEKFTYDLSGLVKVNPALNNPDRVKAQKLINLVGLARKQPRVGTIKWEENSDRRHEHRLQAYVEANNYANDYRNASIAIRAIMFPLLISVSKKGFWSIWMNAFHDFPEVQRALINSHTGTRLNFFTHIP